MRYFLNFAEIGKQYIPLYPHLLIICWLSRRFSIATLHNTLMFTG